MLKYPSVKSTIGKDARILITGERKNEKSKVDIFTHIFGQQTLTERRCRLKWKEYMSIILFLQLSFVNVVYFVDLTLKWGAAIILCSYIICSMLFAMPLFMFNIFLGKYSRRSYLKTWEIVPIYKGIGYTIVLFLLVKETLNVSIAGLSLMYIPKIIKNSLPFTNCDFVYKKCYELEFKQPEYSLYNNTKLDNLKPKMLLNIISSMNGPWVVYDGIVWLIIYIFTIVGYQRFGVLITYITVTVNLVFCIPSFLFVVFTSKNHITPRILRTDWSNFFNVLLWKDIVMQVLISEVPGNFILLGSYSSSKVAPNVDAVVTYGIKSMFFTLITILASTLAATYKSINMQDNNREFIGYDFFFILMPSYLYRWQLNVLWLMLWFILIFVWSCCTAIFTLTGIVDSYIDAFPKMIRYRLCLCTFLCIFGYALNSVLLTKYFIQLMYTWHTHGVKTVVMIIFGCFFLIIWNYSLERIAADYSFVYGQSLNKFWIITITVAKYICLLTAISYTYDMIKTRNNRSNEIDFVCYILMVIILLPILITIVWVYVKYIVYEEGTLFRPSENWGPIDPRQKEFRKRYNSTCQIRYKMSVKCKHHCLLHSTKLLNENKITSDNKRNIEKNIEYEIKKKSQSGDLNYIF